uniref:Uncharacterized protein n=1 Tax=Pyricularia oryzae (strain P131) TaxID=1143193 RepID=L7JCX6_PYRO1
MGCSSIVPGWGHRKHNKVHRVSHLKC